MKAEIREDGWQRYNIWEHSATVRALYTSRALGTAEEMTCATQAVELLVPHVSAGDSLLDAGCGSGYFFHSLKRRAIDVAYHGIDASEALIEIGRRALEGQGLPPDRLRTVRIEDLDGAVDHVVCMNVLTNIDNYHRPLERLLTMARKTLILRESAKNGAAYRYVRDRFLDEDIALNVHVNAYDAGEIAGFIRSYGFEVECIPDRRTGGKPEMVIGHPHWWTFFRAVRTAG